MKVSTSQSISPARTQSLSAVWIIIEPAVLVSKVVSKQAFNKGSKVKADAGGMHGLSPAFSNERALRILKRGISSQVIAPLSDYLAIGKGELVGMLDMDRTTALRRAGKDLPLPTHSAENVLRLLELKDIARDTFESEDAALGWLRRPHPMLDGESPLESAKTSFGSRRVKDILVAIKHGGVV